MSEELKFINDPSLMSIQAEPYNTDITFNHKDTEIIKLCGNGDIYVKGKLIENDKELVEGLRFWLLQMRCPKCREISGE